MLMVTPQSLEGVFPFGPEVVAPEIPYSGFDFWSGLLVIGSERKAADMLKRFGIDVYWANFQKQMQCRGKAHRHKACAVIPGLLLAPEAMLDIPQRRKVFDYAHVHGFMKGTAGTVARFVKAEIEIIREIEAKLNLPLPVFVKKEFKIGQRVRFLNEDYAAFWGTGRVVEVASQTRIGVEVDRLIGSAGKAYVPASEIEAL